MDFSTLLILYTVDVIRFLNRSDLAINDSGFFILNGINSAADYNHNNLEDFDMKRLLPLIVTLVCSMMLSTPAMAQEEPSMVSTKRLTMNTALMIAQASIKACTEKGIQIAVTVVDREGNVQVTLRDTIAAQITLQISKGKAYTAVNFNSATSAMLDRANTPVGRYPGLIMQEGGLPIQVGGALVGAVGVSGAPSGITDEECAQAGIDAVLDDLEMSM